MGSFELGKKIDVFVLSPAWDKEKNLDFFFLIPKSKVSLP